MQSTDCTKDPQNGRNIHVYTHTHPNFSKQVPNHIESRDACGRCVVLDASEGGSRRATLSEFIVACANECGGRRDVGGGGGKSTW